MELLTREMRHVQRSRYDDMTRFQSCQAFTLDRVVAAVPLRSDGFTLLFSLSGGRAFEKNAYAAWKRTLGVRVRPHLLAELHEGRAWGLRGQKFPREALYYTPLASTVGHVLPAILALRSWQATPVDARLPVPLQ